MKSLSPKTIDLYQSFFRRERLTRKQQTTYLKFGAPAAVLVVMVVISGGLYYDTLQLKKQYKPLEVYLNDSATTRVYDKAMELVTTEQQLQKTYQNIQAANDALQSYPKLTKAVFGVVFSNLSDGMLIGEMNYTGATGMLTIAGKATKLTDPADYVEKLKKAGCFDRVEYPGYSSEEEKGKTAGIATDGKATEYSFTISCYIKAPTEVKP